VHGRRCSFYNWLADYKKVAAGKELQLVGEHCGCACSLLQVAGDMKIRSASWVDDRKIDKLINLVQILVVISVVVVIVVLFGVIALLVKH
jgi:hypothetical protein